MAMEDEYDPFDVGGRDYVPDTPGYQASKGTAASTLGYTSDQVYGGGGGDGDENNQFIARPGAGLRKPQFEKTYGITDRNPFGRRSSGFANFLDKFSRAIGGRGVDYSQQFRDLDRLHNRRPGTSAAQFRQRQYDPYRNPDIAADGRITSGGIDRAGRGTYQGPVEMVTREMGPGEQLIRGGIGAVPFAGSYLSGLGAEEPYLASKVTDEMRARENPSLAEQIMGGLGLDDTIESIANKGSSLIERMQGIATGQRQPSAQEVIPNGPAMGSRDPSREIGPLAQSIPAGLTNQDEVAAMAMMPAEMLPADGMPAESDRRISDNTTAEMLREQSLAPQQGPQRTESPEVETAMLELQAAIDNAGLTGRQRNNFLNDVIAQREGSTTSLNKDLVLNYFPEATESLAADYQIAAARLKEMEGRAVNVPTPIGRRFDSPVTEIDTISFQSLFPSEVLDSIAAKPPELVNAPNEGLMRFEDRPRNAPNVGLSRQDFLELFAPEPELGPYEQSQEMTPAEMLREIISQPPSPRTGGQAQVAELDYPELSKISEIVKQLATGENVGGSTKIFGGDLGVTFSPDDRGIGFQFRKELQDKDMGARELLSFLNRITS